MIKVLFVCHGNICRSPMAEFLFRDMVQKRGRADEFVIASAATSTEEIGSGVHSGTRRKLAPLGIDTGGKRAVQITKSDYAEYDFLIGMDSMNVRGILRITGGDPQNKVCRLLDFTDNPRDISDPWYTGDFDKTYDDIMLGLEALYSRLA